jgi:hypothetical protein
MSKALATFLAEHEANEPIDHQRLGQRFVNRYVGGLWTGLYYECDDAKATAMIQKWLEDNQHTDELPTPLGKENISEGRIRAFV